MIYETQIRVNGKVRRKVFLKLNYSDVDSNNKDISIIYKNYKKGNIIEKDNEIKKKNRKR